MKMKYLSGLLLLAVACSGGQTTGGDDTGDASKAQLKQKAAEAHAKPSASSSSGDVCASQGWYGDGECDMFCQDADAKDCTPNSDGVLCALFIEEKNGYCSRKADDPCIGQDPDCSAGEDPSKPPVVCPAIARLPDGICKDDPADPCDVYQDPDCSSGAGSNPTEPADPSGPVICTAIAQVSDGVCKDDPSNPCDFYQDPDCRGSTEPSPPACLVAPEPSDGVCLEKTADPCRAVDPDCAEPVVCTLLIEESDGVCGREPNDPCIFQDPDCDVK